MLRSQYGRILLFLIGVEVFELNFVVDADFGLEVDLLGLDLGGEVGIVVGG